MNTTAFIEMTSEQMELLIEEHIESPENPNWTALQQDLMMWGYSNTEVQRIMHDVRQGLW